MMPAPTACCANEKSILRNRLPRGGHVIVSVLAKDQPLAGAGAVRISAKIGLGALALGVLPIHLYRAFLPDGYLGNDQFLVISSFASAIALPALVHPMQPKTEQRELFSEEVILIPDLCDSRDLFIRQRKSLRSDRNQTSLGGAHCLPTGIARQNVFLLQREP